MKILRLIPDAFLFLRELLLGVVRGNGSAIAATLRRWHYGTPCTIDTNVYIRSVRNFEAGKQSALYHACYIHNAYGKFRIGANSHMGAFCFVNVCYGNVTIGDDVAVGPGTKIIAYSNHYEAGKKVTDLRVTRDVVIGNNVFVGADCTILPGSVVQDNVVIAAGSVVKGELESNSVYGGVPCRKIKSGWYE